MMFPLTILVTLPALAAIAVFFSRDPRIHSLVLLGVSLFHLGLTALLGLDLPRSEVGSLLLLDRVGYLFLFVSSFLFCAVSVYGIQYLRERTHDAPAALHRFVPCLLGFLSMMSMVIVSHHLALMWAAVEATTLTSAPLIYFYRRKTALEATWKYLMICSVGIALALLGTFCLGIATSSVPSGEIGLFLSGLREHGSELARPWLKVAFVLALVGYGTKMGLAPLHSWLPDAHSQAPSPVSALLSGALLNCAFLGILRFYQVCLAAGEARFAQDLLIATGIASLLVGAAFILGQRDYKRLFAYSSVENMGVLALGIGVGGKGVFGAIWHAVGHSFTKGALFLVAGNILHLFGTTIAADVRGLFRREPLTAGLLLAGLFAIGGFPPFSLFLSELMIFQGAMNAAPWVAVIFVILLTIAFLGMASTVIPMVQDKPTREDQPGKVATVSWGAPLLLLTIVLAMGIALPSGLQTFFGRVASELGGEP